MATAPGGGRASDSERHDVDWEAVEHTPEFQELVKSRRRFVIPATIFFLAWYLGFILLCGYAPGFMGESIYQGFTVGYALALTQFVMVWVLAAAYVRRFVGGFYLTMGGINAGIVFADAQTYQHFADAAYLDFVTRQFGVVEQAALGVGPGHQWLPAMFRPITPAMIRPRLASLRVVAGSPKAKIPTAAIIAVPAAAQTA